MCVMEIKSRDQSLTLLFREIKRESVFVWNEYQKRFGLGTFFERENEREREDL